MRVRILSIILTISILTACEAFAPKKFESGEEAVARLQSLQKESITNLDSVTASVTVENRDAIWAGPMESKLKSSFDEIEELKNTSLVRTDCRSSACLIEVDLQTTNDLSTLVVRRQAATDWIAWSQPCAYTVASENAVLSELKIVINCDDE